MKIGMITGADTAQAERDWRYQCPFLADTRVIWERWERRQGCATHEAPAVAAVCYHALTRARGSAGRITTSAAAARKEPSDPGTRFSDHPAIEAADRR